MRIIPVLDVTAGLAVHARGGDRAHYPRLRSPVHGGPDPIDLASSFRDICGFTDLYLADLDAIGGAPPALELYRALAGLGMSLWVDAGLRDASAVGMLLDAGASTVVAGSETLGGVRELADLVDRLGERLVFGVDIRHGAGLHAPGADWGTAIPEEMGLIAAKLGCRRLLLLDLSGVGTGRGPDRSRLGRLRAADPGLSIAVGGGVGGMADLGDLRRAGASAALVGSALYEGKLTTSRE